MPVAQFAREMDVAPNTVRDRIKSGRMSKAVLEDGSLDPEVARALWWKNTNPARVTLREKDKPKQSATARLAQEAEKGEGGKASEYDLKLEKMAVDLDTAKLNLETLRRTTIPREEARRAVRALMRINRDTFQQFANRHAGEIAAEVGCDERKLMSALDSRLRHALIDASDQPIPFEDDAR